MNKLVDHFGEYDPELDLSDYQYPGIDLLPDSLQPIFRELKSLSPSYQIPIVLNGVDKIVVRDLCHRPNLLLAGTIASGKTQFIYNQLIGWLFTFHPAELKLVLCRSKPVDYNSMANVERHFLAKIPDEGDPIVEYGQIIGTLGGVSIECDLRLDLFTKAHVKTFAEYNHKFIHRELDPAEGHRFLPNMVVILDDLETFLGEKVTEMLIAVTQKNLYTGIYVIAATSQIQSRKITPQLRANFSTRVAMKLMSQNESRKILDRAGAERLSPPGELLYEESNHLVKGAQPMIDYGTILNITEFVSSQQGYPSAFLLPQTWKEMKSSILNRDGWDMKFEEAARLVVIHQPPGALQVGGYGSSSGLLSRYCSI